MRHRRSEFLRIQLPLEFKKPLFSSVKILHGVACRGHVVPAMSNGCNTLQTSKRKTTPPLERANRRQRGLVRGRHAQWHAANDACLGECPVLIMCTVRAFGLFSANSLKIRIAVNLASRSESILENE